MNGAPSSPLILGIDPGLRVCGWGVVRAATPPAFVACGAIRPRTALSVEQRLLYLNTEIARLIDSHQPDEVAVEDPFVGSLNPASALAIGQARAAAMLAAAARNIDVSLYAPAAVKSTVTGYGQGDKRQVQTMVKMLLRLDAAPEPADAADALAIALTHIAQRRVRALTSAAR
jgi:crossover junction endodeoxyribonuclease RuvC